MPIYFAWFTTALLSVGGDANDQPTAKWAPFILRAKRISRHLSGANRPIPSANLVSGHATYQAQTSDLARESGEICDNILGNLRYRENGKGHCTRRLCRVRPPRAFVARACPWWIRGNDPDVCQFSASLVGSDTRGDSTRRGICPFVQDKASQEKPKPEVHTLMHRTTPSEPHGTS